MTEAMGSCAARPPQEPARQREVRDEPETEAPAGREELLLRLALEPGVLALLRDVRLLRQLRRLFELRGGVVGGAVGADLPLADEVVEGLDRLGERRRGIFSVVLIEVDVVRLEPFEAPFERSPDLFA
jgi:hypothetical protein